MGKDPKPDRKPCKEIFLIFNYDDDLLQKFVKSQLKNEKKLIKSIHTHTHIHTPTFINITKIIIKNIEKKNSII